MVWQAAVSVCPGPACAVHREPAAQPVRGAVPVAGAVPDAVAGNSVPSHGRSGKVGGGVVEYDCLLHVGLLDD